VFGNSIIACMTGNAWFTKPSPSLSKVKTSLTTLQKRQAATLTRSMDTRTARDAAWLAALRLLQRLASYVQKIADSNLENSLAIIQSAGMSAKKGSGSRAHVFKVDRYRVSGSARVTAPTAGDDAYYDWQMSTDGRKTWIDLRRTGQSTTVVPGLTPGTTVFFRYRTLTKKGTSDWSDPIAYLVD
jgi:type II secretory pathway pseudopilin PulG